MNASAVLRKLLDLDKLEARIKLMRDPSPVLIKQIQDERAKLLRGEDATNKAA